MPERISHKERRTLTLTSLSLLGALGLSGCAFALEEVRDFTPAERFQFDYLQLNGNIANGNEFEDQCFVETAYDINAGRWAESTPPAISYDAVADILRITPPSGDVLSLTGYTQFETTMTPADEVSQAIFDAYGCTEGEYVWE